MDTSKEVKLHSDDEKDDNSLGDIPHDDTQYRYKRIMYNPSTSRSRKQANIPLTERFLKRGKAADATLYISLSIIANLSGGLASASRPFGYDTLESVIRREKLDIETVTMEPTTMYKSEPYVIKTKLPSSNSPPPTIGTLLGSTLVSKASKEGDGDGEFNTENEHDGNYVEGSAKRDDNSSKSIGPNYGIDETPDTFNIPNESFPIVSYTIPEFTNTQPVNEESEFDDQTAEVVRIPTTPVLLSRPASAKLKEMDPGSNSLDKKINIPTNSQDNSDDIGNFATNDDIPYPPFLKNVSRLSLINIAYPGVKFSVRYLRWSTRWYGEDKIQQSLYTALKQLSHDYDDGLLALFIISVQSKTNKKKTVGDWAMKLKLSMKM